MSHFETETTGDTLFSGSMSAPQRTTDQPDVNRVEPDTQPVEKFYIQVALHRTEVMEKASTRYDDAIDAFPKE